MDIRGLGYIGIGVGDVAAWQDYAAVLGTMVVPDGAGFGMKVDDHPFRILVEAADGPDGLTFAGWALPDAPALERATVELERAGCTVRSGSRAECERRRVRGLVSTTDPSGFTVELFHGTIHDHQRFVSPAGISGFVTGPLGMGHIVLGSPRLAESVRFYTAVLGFRVSDYWRPGDDDVVFLRCNQRHHSLALTASSAPTLHHFMLEARTVDDVGYTLDRHVATGTPISAGLGRHANDRMLSFYSRSPSGFDVEFGCGGLLVDEDTWTVSEITLPSVWGHRRPAP